MQTPEEERAYWSPRTARAEIWSKPGEAAWEEGISSCLEEVLGPFAATIACGVFLDLGCGVGRLTNALAQRYPSSHFHGVDICQAMLDVAKRERAERSIRNAFYHLGDGRSLPFPGMLDGAYSMLLFQHIPRQAVRGYIGSVAGLLAPGAVFHFQFADGDEEAPMSHLHPVSDLMQTCVEAGLDAASFPSAIEPCWKWIRALRPIPPKSLVLS